jgi:hypothetical protein
MTGTTTWSRQTCHLVSEYGDVPLCDAPATHLVVHRNAASRDVGATFRTPVCARHVGAMQGIVYPWHLRTEPVPGGREVDR